MKQQIYRVNTYSSGKLSRDRRSGFTLCELANDEEHHDRDEADNHLDHSKRAIGNFVLRNGTIYKPALSRMRALLYV